MKQQHKNWLYWGIGGVAALYLLRKPFTSAVWKLWVGPKYYTALAATIQRNDPAEIAQLKAAYAGWYPETRQLFDESLAKLKLRRPW